MEELYLLDAVLSAEMYSVQEQQTESDEDETLSEGRSHAESLIGDVQTSLQSLFDLCANFPSFPQREKPSVLPLKFLIPPPSDFIDSLTPWLLSYHHQLFQQLTTLHTQFLTAISQLKASKSIISVLTKLIKSKDETLDSISEELYLSLMERLSWQSPDQDSALLEPSFQYSGRKADGSIQPLSLFEVEEDDPENRKKLAEVLAIDGLRQRMTLSQCVHIWKSQCELGENQPSSTVIQSVEGNYKRNLLVRNPLLSSCKKSGEGVLPPPCLFNHLFGFLDQCFGVIMSEPKDKFCCVKCVTEEKVQSRVVNEVKDGLPSLEVYYAEESIIAGVFSRLLHVFDSDPLLSAPSKELVLLNAALKTLTIKRNSVRDLESGGYISITDALNFAFSLQLSLNESLLTHFLRVLRPPEMSELEWTKFVISQRKKDTLAQIPISTMMGTTGSMTVLRSFIGSSASDLEKEEDLSQLGDVLEVGRGELLGYLLQVYDLYVDQLYVMVGSRANRDIVSRSDFCELLKVLHPTVSEDCISEMWGEAVRFSRKSDWNFAEKDAVLLAMITGECAEVAAQPLIGVRKQAGSLSIRTELTEESDDIYTSSYPSKPRSLFTPRGRQSVRRSVQPSQFQ